MNGEIFHDYKLKDLKSKDVKSLQIDIQIESNPVILSVKYLCKYRQNYSNICVERYRL